jgi:hypothetical protein
MKVCGPLLGYFHLDGRPIQLLSDIGDLLCSYGTQAQGFLSACA